MKNSSISPCWGLGKKTFALNHEYKHTATFFLWTILAGFLFTSCEKQAFETHGTDPLITINAKPSSPDNTANRTEGEILNMYSGLSNQTMWELQQARAATARYRDIK